MLDHEAYRHRSWSPQPEAEAVVADLIRGGIERCEAAAAFAVRALEVAGVRLRDIVDHIEVADPAALARLRAVGWQDDGGGLVNRAGLFPAVRPSDRFRIWLRVEAVDDFVGANGLQPVIEGRPHGPYRRAIVFRASSVEVGVVERNGHPGLELPDVDEATIRTARRHLQAFRARRRQFDTVEQGLAYTEGLVDSAVAALGPHWACDLWLKAERDYWMGRCPAGRLQKARQDALGIGWANIDHHTYDGSRGHFRHTIRILEKLGYELREMLYAGELAGWGSQVLEQPVIGSTIFADVDLAPEELAVDFAHQALPPLDQHRRAGLLSALLGESILEAGLNHVAALYDNHTLRAQLATAGIEMMKPFTDWPHLYQELTLGDWGAVDPVRVDKLEAQGHLGPEEAEKLRLEGSIVTHLENIERNDGYKGFNREGIDSVLRKLDPRAYLASAKA